MCTDRHGRDRQRRRSTERRHPHYASRYSTSPYTTLAAVPNTITGPATVNILTAVPVTMPSACVKIGTREIFALFYWVFGFSNF